MKVEKNNEQMEDSDDYCYQKSWHIMDMGVDFLHLSEYNNPMRDYHLTRS